MSTRLDVIFWKPILEHSVFRKAVVRMMKKIHTFQALSFTCETVRRIIILVFFHSKSILMAKHLASGCTSGYVVPKVHV